MPEEELDEETSDLVLPSSDRSRQLSSLVATFKAAIIQTKPYGVSLTEKLPHIRFPVGLMDPEESPRHKTTISGVFDTGSGITIGYYPYWKEISERYPELVYEFTELEEGSFERIKIGGIEKEGEGAFCTHRITLKTPFVTDGLPVQLTIALTSDLSCNLIFGLPFSIKARMTANLADRFVTSEVFKAVFPLEYHPPLLMEKPMEQLSEALTFQAEALREVVGVSQVPQ